MARAIDAANFFITIMQDDEERLTNKKINKLLYFVQGHSFLRLGHQFFDEDIQAWDHGPVVPSIYHTFKVCGFEPISEPTETLPEFTKEEAALLIDVAREYGKYTGAALERETHKKGTPWQEYYVEGVKNIVIPKKVIEKYFLNRKLPTIDDAIDGIPEIGYFDRDGYTVLPKEWKDEL